MTDIGATFRDLHRPGSPFILANVWDAGSAQMMAALGAKALATSSAAHAFVMGRADGGTLTRDETLAHAADIVAATRLPVQGDFENGFGDDPETCAETVRLAASIGLAGICIEDTEFPSGQSYDFDLAVERIRAAAAAARALPHDFVLTARADGFLTGSYGVPEALRRLQAFRAAGADCLYAPYPPTPEDQAMLCRAAGGPVNVLITGAYTKLSHADYAAMGAARLSLGSSLARAVHKVILDAGHAMFDAGDFTPLGNGASGAAISDLMAKGAR